MTCIPTLPIADLRLLDGAHRLDHTTIARLIVQTRSVREASASLTADRRHELALTEECLLLALSLMHRGIWHGVPSK